MDKQPPVEFNLDLFADPKTVRDVIRGVLHTIFFHRFFPSIAPRTREVLDLTLPSVPDAELETLIEQRATSLERQLEAERAASSSSAANGAASSSSGGGRARVVVQFFEKVRRKTWITRGDDEVCWEMWTVRVTVADPRTEGERAKVLRATEDTLQRTVLDIVTKAGAHKDHIPPITTQGSNPFPYKIIVAADQQQKDPPGWAARMGWGPPR